MCIRDRHKAKGDEFENVLVVFTEEKALNMIINPNLKDNESDRVYYVAMSRARERLFLTAPSISQQMENTLRRLPIDIKKI